MTALPSRRGLDIRYTSLGVDQFGSKVKVFLSYRLACDALVVNTTLHPDIATLGALVGTWTGQGHGEYPTITSFDYEETVTFAHMGKPFLSYLQRTSSVPDGHPLHIEVGYLRMPSPGIVEMIVSQPTGIAEVDEGTITAADSTSAEPSTSADPSTGPAATIGSTLVLDLHSASVATSTSAKPVTQVTRRIVIDGDVMHYELKMAAMGLDLTHHLSATLHKVE